LIKDKHKQHPTEGTMDYSMKELVNNMVLLISKLIAQGRKNIFKRGRLQLSDDAGETQLKFFGQPC